jgi:arsenate reductase
VTLKILHNANCSKSNAAIEILRDKKIVVEVVNYLQDPLDKNEIIKVLNALKMRPIEIVRHKELAWIESGLDENSPDCDVVNILTTHPHLMERPIIYSENVGVVGRPVTNLIDFLDNEPI